MPCLLPVPKEGFTELITAKSTLKINGNVFTNYLGQIENQLKQMDITHYLRMS